MPSDAEITITAYNDVSSFKERHLFADAPIEIGSDKSLPALFFSRSPTPHCLCTTLYFSVLKTNRLVIELSAAELYVSRDLQYYSTDRVEFFKILQNVGKSHADYIRISVLHAGHSVCLAPSWLDESAYHSSEYLNEASEPYAIDTLPDGDTLELTIHPHCDSLIAILQPHSVDNRLFRVIAAVDILEARQNRIFCDLNEQRFYKMPFPSLRTIRAEQLLDVLVSAEQLLPSANPSGFFCNRWFTVGIEQFERYPHVLHISNLPYGMPTPLPGMDQLPDIPIPGSGFAPPVDDVLIDSGTSMVVAPLDPVDRPAAPPTNSDAVAPIQEHTDTDNKSCARVPCACAARAALAREHLADGGDHTNIPDGCWPWFDHDSEPELDPADDRDNPDYVSIYDLTTVADIYKHFELDVSNIVAFDASCKWHRLPVTALTTFPLGTELPMEIFLSGRSCSQCRQMKPSLEQGFMYKDPVVHEKLFCCESCADKLVRKCFAAVSGNFKALPIKMAIIPALGILAPADRRQASTTWDDWGLSGIRTQFLRRHMTDPLFKQAHEKLGK